MLIILWSFYFETFVAGGWESNALLWAPKPSAYRKDCWTVYGGGDLVLHSEGEWPPLQGILSLPGLSTTPRGVLSQDILWFTVPITDMPPYTVLNDSLDAKWLFCWLFNYRCSTKEGDVLVFATSSDLQENRQEFNGTSGANWTSFQVPG